MVKNVGGILGVWIHNNRENSGIACLISPDLGLIGGTAPYPSWVFYSQHWNSDEENFFSESIAKITQDNVGSPGVLPFTFLGTLVNCQLLMSVPPTEDQKLAVVANKESSRLPKLPCLQPSNGDPLRL